jgi:hypothetical protein
MKLDETHKKKKQQTVNAPPCRQHGWHGRQKNGLRKKRLEEEKQAEARPAEEAVLSRMQPASGRGAAAGETKEPS